MPLNVEEAAVYIIANAGDSKSNSFAAIEAAEEGNLEKANELLKKSEEGLSIAHKSHTELIREDCGDGLKLTFLLVHASNLLSNAELALDFARRFIKLYERR